MPTLIRSRPKTGPAATATWGSRSLRQRPMHRNDALGCWSVFGESGATCEGVSGLPACKHPKSFVCGSAHDKQFRHFGGPIGTPCTPARAHAHAYAQAQAQAQALAPTHTHTNNVLRRPAHDVCEERRVPAVQVHAPDAAQEAHHAGHHAEHGPQLHGYKRRGGTGRASTPLLGPKFCGKRACCGAQGDLLQAACNAAPAFARTVLTACASIPQLVNGSLQELPGICSHTHTGPRLPHRLQRLRRQ